MSEISHRARETKRITIHDLVEALAKLNEWERIEFCDALVDRPELRELLETIDDYLYVETDEPLLLDLLNTPITKDKRILN